MAITKRPAFRELSPADCCAVLANNVVGRIAFVSGGQVFIEPMHYVLDGDWIVGRTSPGLKTNALRHRPWVAFQVDEIEGPFDWRSVVAHGSVHFPDPAGSESDRDAYDHVVAHIRRVAPAALTPGDPTPNRDVVLRIHVDSLEGRAAAGGA
jgi:nitroimidazol reductase NimA-like FMN-containing flavoprotein (pyridoxamine 5'-phosphate oxidase superfamily)